MQHRKKYFIYFIIYLTAVLTVFFENIQQVCWYALYVLFQNAGEVWLASYSHWTTFQNREHIVVSVHLHQLYI